MQQEFSAINDEVNDKENWVGTFFEDSTLYNLRNGAIKFSDSKKDNA
jgi:hypothetical protein